MVHIRIMRANGQPITPSVMAVSVCLIVMMLALHAAPQPSQRGAAPQQSERGAPPLVGVPSYEEWKRQHRAGRPEATAEKPKFEWTLDDYPIGEPTHPKSFSFCESVAAAIREIGSEGRQVSRIVVLGSADGLHNPGREVPRALPLPCRQAVRSPMKDRELAFLRGCVVREQLTDIVTSDVASDIAWFRDEFDQPDNGKSDRGLRSVKVSIFAVAKQ